MKIRHVFFTILCLGCFLSAPSFAASDSMNYGIINFATCVTESEYGKQEQEAFENIKTQMTTLMTDIEKQLNDLADKFNNPEFVDSLSPEAEQEMKARFQSLNEELNRYQNQYYQVMNQANMKLVQTMSTHVNQASETVAKQKKIAMVLNKDAAFFYQPSQDITALVIKEMDNSFAKESKNQKPEEATKK